MQLRQTEFFKAFNFLRPRLFFNQLVALLDFSKKDDSKIKQYKKGEQQANVKKDHTHTSSRSFIALEIRIVLGLLVINGLNYGASCSAQKLHSPQFSDLYSTSFYNYI